MLRQAKWLASAGFLFLLAAGAMAQAFDIESATRAYLSSTSAEAIANTDGYVNTGYVIMLLEAVAAVLVAWLVPALARACGGKVKVTLCPGVYLRTDLRAGNHCITVSA